MRKINAVIRLGDEYCSERNRTTIVITDEGDKVLVGVKAIAHVFEKNDYGTLNVHEEQHGDLIAIDRDASISKIFDTLREMLDAVPEIIDRTNNGDKA